MPGSEWSERMIDSLKSAKENLCKTPGLQSATVSNNLWTSNGSSIYITPGSSCDRGTWRVACIFLLSTASFQHWSWRQNMERRNCTRNISHQHIVGNDVRSGVITHCVIPEKRCWRCFRSNSSSAYRCLAIDGRGNDSSRISFCFVWQRHATYRRDSLAEHGCTDDRKPFPAG